MSVQKRKKPAQDSEENPSLSATISKAFKANSKWEDKEEFLDVIYWFRQVIALFLGFVWGVIPMKGIIGIGLFCLVNAGTLYVYHGNFQKVDDEEYGGVWELTKEGFMTSFALFLVVWIITYSALYS